MKTAGIHQEKPFDLLAEGLLRIASRSDKTAIELFLSCLRDWTRVVSETLNPLKGVDHLTWMRNPI